MYNTTLSLSVPPTDEPVSLDEALTQCHAEAGVEDAWFTSRITAGRQKVEDYIKRSIMPQTWVYRIEGNTLTGIDLPRSPLIQLVSAFAFAPNTIENKFAINLNEIQVFCEGCPAHIIIPQKYIGGILRIEYIAGYDTVLIPAPLKDAILLYVSHNYENRAGEKDLPHAFYDLIEPYRLHIA